MNGPKITESQARWYLWMARKDWMLWKSMVLAVRLALNPDVEHVRL